MGSRLASYTHDGLSFDVRDEGPVDGEVIVLLHGFPQTSTSWARVAPHLHAAGFRTLAPDQRGYSPGARPTRRRDYRLDHLVGDVVALVRATGHDAVHLVGHDWGAAVGWAVVGASPELVQTYTAVSVPHPGAFVRSMLSSNQALKSSYMALFQLPVIPEKLLSQRGGRGDALLRSAGMTRSMLEDFHDHVVDYGALRGGLGYYRSLPLSSRSGLGKGITVPTTYVWSDGDTALGRKGADLNAQWMAGPYELEVVEGASHWLPDERPAELAEIIARRIGV